MGLGEGEPWRQPDLDISTALDVTCIGKDSGLGLGEMRLGDKGDGGLGEGELWRQPDLDISTAPDVT